MLAFDEGSSEDRTRTEEFVDAYDRRDVSVLSFFSNEKKVRDNYDKIVETLDTLVKEGHLRAYEFALGTPLPQCDVVVELHTLVNVEPPAAQIEEYLPVYVSAPRPYTYSWNTTQWETYYDTEESGDYAHDEYVYDDIDDEAWNAIG